jgi:hypothetical protein
MTLPLVTASLSLGHIGPKGWGVCQLEKCDDDREHCDNARDPAFAVHYDPRFLASRRS